MPSTLLRTCFAGDTPSLVEVLSRWALGAETNDSPFTMKAEKYLVPDRTCAGGPDDTIATRRSLAESAARRLERHLCDAPFMDADRRQDSPCANPVDEPFLARHLVRDAEGPQHGLDSIRRASISNRLRLYRARAQDPVQ